MRFRLTVRPALTIISSVTACIAWGSTLTRLITNRTRLTITGRAKHRRGRNAAVLNHTRSAWKAIKFASSPSFGEYYSHPRLFWLSQTPFEQRHIVDGFSFELSKVVRPYIRERVVDQLAHIDLTLAQAVAKNLGIELTDDQLNITPPPDVNGLKKDPSLSLYAIPDGDVKGRVVAILLNDEVRSADLLAILKALKAKGVHAKLLYSRMGEVTADDGTVLPIAATFAGAPSLTVDAVIVPCGNIADIADNGDANYYLMEAYKHLKPIALAGDARKFKATIKVADQGEEGIVEADSADGSFMDELLTLMAAHRVWSRIPKIDKIPA